MKIVVTGAAGFIGSNLIRGLNARGFEHIIAVDDLSQGDKFRNLADLQIADYVDMADFYPAFASRSYGHIEAVFHEGACSDTMESDGRYMLRNNFTLSCDLFAACHAQNTRLLYASSAAVYGGSRTFIEAPEFEKPLNVYGYSKLLFDQWLRRTLGGNAFETATTQVAGFRYFNVYGPREQHKGRMASVAFHQFGQFMGQGKVRLFGGHDGYGPGEQLRDFVHIDDVVAVNLWFFDHPEARGIYNLGTGRAEPFNSVALAVVNALKNGHEPYRLADAVHDRLIEYTDFPAALIGKYQSYTQADLSLLRSAGCDHKFLDVQTGVTAYVQTLSLKNQQY